MALSIGILSRSILNGTQTVPLSTGIRSKDNLRPQAGKWCGCLPSANHRVSKTPDGFVHASCIFVGRVHSAMIGRRASLGRVSRGLTMSTILSGIELEGIVAKLM